MARIIGKLRDAAAVLFGLMVGSGLGLAVAFGFVSAYHLALDAQPAQAAPVDAAGCDYLATVDTVKIWQCVDFDGDKFLASTGAFLEYAKDGE